jgi:hypothetical protein
MAIYQRDRDFQNLFSQIEVDVIPIKFIQDVTCILKDGNKVVLDKSDFAFESENAGDLESILKNLPFYDELQDLSIRIDYNLVESEVEAEVNTILENVKK